MASIAFLSRNLAKKLLKSVMIWLVDLLINRKGLFSIINKNINGRVYSSKQPKHVASILWKVKDITQ